MKRTLSIRGRDGAKMLTTRHYQPIRFFDPVTCAEWWPLCHRYSSIGNWFNATLRTALRWPFPSVCRVRIAVRVFGMFVGIEGVGSKVRASLRGPDQFTTPLQADSSLVLISSDDPWSRIHHDIRAHETSARSPAP